MRDEEMKAGAWVQVRAYATGDASDLRGQIGRIESSYAGEALIEFLTQTRNVRGRWLTAVPAPTTQEVPEELKSPVPATSTESPEVTAFKRTIARIAQRYARSHDWCEVVDRALREMGIEPAPPGKWRFVLEIPEDAFDDMSLESDESMEDPQVAHRELCDVLSGNDHKYEWLKSFEFVNGEGK